MQLSAVLTRHNIETPDETLAALDVPLLTTPQRQGDVGIFPRANLSAAERKSAVVVPPEGIAVVRGEATGNTHMLDAVVGDVLWIAHPQTGSEVRLGAVCVPEGGEAYLVHTDEHGANGLAPGTYWLHGKREQAEIARRVAD